MSESKHSIVIAWSEEDQMFVGLCPELQVSGLGDRRSTAFGATLSAIDLALESYADHELTPPKPQGIEAYKQHAEVKPARACRTLDGRPWPPEEAYKSNTE